MSDIALLHLIVNALADMAEGVVLNANQRDVLDELLKSAAEMLVVHPYKGD